MREQVGRFVETASWHTALFRHRRAKLDLVEGLLEVGSGLTVMTKSNV